VAGVFALGVFSGSRCCARPRRIVTLSALSGSALGSVILGSAYVFGMVFPLFAIALVWDRFHIGDRRVLTGRDVTLGHGAHAVHTSTTNMVVAGVFALMGLLVIVLGLTGNPMWSSAPRWRSDVG
jgi:cytochrome c biogenesis protein CcdA